MVIHYERGGIVEKNLLVTIFWEIRDKSGGCSCLEIPSTYKKYGEQVFPDVIVGEGEHCAYSVVGMWPSSDTEFQMPASLS